MIDLAGLLDLELSRGVEQVEVLEAETIDFGELAGPEHRADRTAFAELLAGTEDKSSRPYKAARRNVERWVKGRVPMQVSVRRIVAVRRQQDARLAAMRRHGGRARMLVSWYSSRRPEWLPPRRWVTIRQRTMRGVIRQWAEGDLAGAADQLAAEWLGQYGVPNPADWMRDVEVEALELEPRG